ncbi:hypothetical protein ACFQL1_02070 [Halomicroarcula sp. GCM10025709]|uniref:hypothetical protein n=1 Tax=Halomicroarcula sp. GCM10025709 TaxID=3252669 RepID=UPI00361A2BA2
MTLRGVVLDLDGTVYHGDNVLPGVDGLVETVRARDCSLCFFSNNPIHDGDDYVQRLRGSASTRAPARPVRRAWSRASISTPNTPVTTCSSSAATRSATRSVRPRRT